VLVTPAGGLVYHLRALRYRGTLWLPFRRMLSAWLAQNLPESEVLVLVGPSAGHCLPLEQLGRAKQLVLLEPDPLARWLLAQRLASQAPLFERRDLLVRPLLAGTSGLDAVLARWPRASVLFCNVLGQLHFGLDDAQDDQFRKEFRRRLWPALRGRAWASFHDRWSFEPDESVPSTPSSLHFERLPNDEQLAEACFGAGQQAVTVLDHGTAELFPDALPRDYFTWQLTPRAQHLVEAVAGRAETEL
jgi:hypothetical protein